MGTTELIEGIQWLAREFFKFFYSPMEVAGGFLDAFRGWRFSRRWARIWFHLPSVALLAAAYLTFAFSIFGREDSRIQLFSLESQKLCPTKRLEETYDQMQELDFAKVTGTPAVEVQDDQVGPISDLTKRYVELLSKRILSIQPSNLAANYRIALIHFINGDAEDSLSIMKELALGTFGDCPQANAWVAKALLKQTATGTNVSNSELLSYMEKASKWKDVDPRLVSFYSKALEQSGDTLKAISVTKQGAATRPELNLELARLYYRVGYQNEMRSAASVVEDIFSKKLNTRQEKETDRLAVAEARKMTNRLEQAAETLSEGLLNQDAGPAIRRELSDVLLLIYRKSIFKTEAGAYLADLSQLEKACEVDPLNPSLSTAIAQLQPFKIKPSKNLVEILRQQLEAGVTTAAAHIFLAEGYFAFGNTDEAIKNWEIALTKDPNHVSSLNNLALILARTSEANVDRSLELLNKASALSPGNAEILDSLGDVLLIANRPIDAINKFERAIKSDPTRFATRKKLMNAYQRNGMEDMAAALSKVMEKMEKGSEVEQAKPKQ